ncbi:MAG: redoxin family protein [Acetobacteraceae bacterium]|nr:redoxin family protein [Acetobacteraceae bacterium]
MFRALLVLSVLSAAGGALYAYWGVLMPPSMQPAPGRGDATPLLDKRVPGFALPGLIGPGFEARDLLTTRRPVLVKFWGSWSPTCIQEYPLLFELRNGRVEMWAIAFRDNRTNALDYLERNGNPYRRVAYDAAGRVASDWGVRSAPSSFLVDGDGIVRWHRAGPLTAEIVARELWPLMQRYGQ